jgi:hypothetical protein
MRKQTMLSLTLLLVPVLSGQAFAQGGIPKAAEEPKYFHLDFVVKELDNGKVTNSRAYTMTIATDSSGSSIRTGNKVPIPTSSGSSSSFTYIDVGVNIDCRSAKQIADELALNITAEISTAASEPPSGSPPLIRQTKWSSAVIVPLRKPTTIFSSDDPSSKRQTQLELTATPIR